ncbi:restriction endonuclease subunit S [Leptolyngbya boryana CZ1]|uniref:Restriction endonuclease subunit S n=1 Tax=Leptolyngbya boryana CZ1 TaxID=3060204 RepID=A0AA96X5S8_LEPBY|nr:restriction endonuclease subunit S [Leptolyngbya boryana]WNZ46115.1 restriction endonuclease subunit S [Leptolyngbya boryana CZ1]
MSDELIELPEGWGWTSFEEIAEKVPNALKAGPFGSALKKSFYVSSGYKIYGQEQVINEDPFFGDYYIDEERFESLKSCAVKPGDILISLVGTIGKVLILPEGIKPGIINPRLVKLSLDNSLVSNQYIKAFLESPTVRGYFAKLSHGGTMDILNLSILKTLSIPLPPIAEQKRIVAKIEELRSKTQKAREALETIPEMCDRFRQSVLAAAFRGDLTADWREENSDVEPASTLLEEISRKQANPQKKGRRSREVVADIRANQSKLEDLPETWLPIQIRDVCQLQTGYAFKSSWFVPEGIKLLRGINVVPGSIRWDEVVYLSEEQSQEFTNYFLEQGDIIIAMDRPVISSGLKIAKLTYQDVPALLLQRVGRFSLTNVIDSEYLFCYLNSHIFLSHIKDQATGTQLPHISANDIESAVLPLPPLLEQREIAKEVSIVLQKIDLIQQQYEAAKVRLEKLDRAILAKAFRGELVAQDPNDDPASVLLEQIREERAKVSDRKSTKRKK